MSFYDIFLLSLRNLREAKLRSSLTTMGVIVGVAVIVTMVSFGLGLQRNTVNRFKELDLFNEVTVFGRSLTTIATTDPANNQNQNSGSQNQGRNRGPGRNERESKRALDDAALDEISKIPGVIAVEPNISFVTFVRVDGRNRIETISGLKIPNPASRFKEFGAGSMISSSTADETIVTDSFIHDFGIQNASEAIGKEVELLAPPGKGGESQNIGFFGIPMPDAEGDDSGAPRVVKKLRITGVLKDSGGPNLRGLSIAGNLYVNLDIAKNWRNEFRDSLSELAMQIARQAGALGGENSSSGYGSAIIRVTDPGVLKEVRQKLSDLGFNSFSIVDQLEQLRTVFLVMNSVLGLLGGISLLVASFGIANTMIMSILERTREIGIMKAIGAEDREIKMIFFIEAAVIGLAGGVVGCLSAVAIDALANRLTYRFVLKPKGSNYIDFFSIPVYLWVGAIIFAIAVAVVAALYPASRAASIDPVKALRHD